ncbi:MAG TPA: ABC transporter permease [Actinomycetota bacterium]|nr:ABC transporter permease [Actinomycetota bacterium]
MTVRRDAAAGGGRTAGAPRAGWRVVAAKETADHLLSARFTVLLLLVALSAVGAVYAASGGIRDVAEQAQGLPGVFLLLFTAAPERLPSFVTLVGFLAPLLGIAFGFDAVNGERAGRTLPRLVAQPIRRDDVINGKFAGGLTVIAAVLAALTLLVAGLGIVRLGTVPSAEEGARLLAWLVVTVAYAGFWLALATALSVVLRRAATSALVAMAAWLCLTLFAGFLVGLAADAIAPVPADATPEQQLANLRAQVWLGRISPRVLYDEATLVLLNPQARGVGFFFDRQLDQAIPRPLPLDQSLLVVWPQLVALVALCVLCFAAAYVLFMRQEIRA